MKKQQTAVEWLYKILQSEPLLTVEDFNKAKEMEQKQIVDAHDNGYIDGANKKKTTAEQYYNETYGDELNTKSI